MAESNPLIYSVGFLLFIGLVLPFCLSFVVDLGTITPSTLVEPLVDIVEDGFEIGVIPFVDWDNFNINPFSWLGETLQGYFSDSLTYLGILPDFLVVIILILSVLSIFYTLIKLVPFT